MYVLAPTQHLSAIRTAVVLKFIGHHVLLCTRHEIMFDVNYSMYWPVPRTCELEVLGTFSFVVLRVLASTQYCSASQTLNCFVIQAQ